MRHSYVLGIKGHASFSIEPNLLPTAQRSIFRFEDRAIRTIGHELAPDQSSFDDLVFYFDKEEPTITLRTDSERAVHSYIYDLKGFLTVTIRANSQKAADALVANLDGLAVLTNDSHSIDASLNEATFFSDDEAGPLLLQIDDREVD